MALMVDEARLRVLLRGLIAPEYDRPDAWHLAATQVEARIEKIIEECKKRS